MQHQKIAEAGAQVSERLCKIVFNSAPGNVHLISNLANRLMIDPAEPEDGLALVREGCNTFGNGVLKFADIHQFLG